MGGIHASGYANADMIRALGSLVTRRYEGSFATGLGIHLVSAMLFAIPYTAILGAFPAMSPMMWAASTMRIAPTSSAISRKRAKSITRL